MESKVEYRVLAPDSVAWHIQAALVADRSGNEAARDLALCEAARVAAERRLVEPMKRYDCRTIDQRLAELEDSVSRLTLVVGGWQLLSTTHVSATVHERLAALERAAAPAMANREWMDEVERRLASGEKQIREQSLVLVSLDQWSDGMIERMEKVWSALRERGVPLEVHDANSTL